MRDAVEHELLAEQPHRVDRAHAGVRQLVVGRVARAGTRCRIGHRGCRRVGWSRSCDRSFLRRTGDLALHQTAVAAPAHHPDGMNPAGPRCARPCTRSISDDIYTAAGLGWAAVGGRRRPRLGRGASAARTHVGDDDRDDHDRHRRAGRRRRAAAWPAASRSAAASASPCTSRRCPSRPPGPARGPGRCDGGDAARRADEHRREDGAAAEARERQRVGEALADHEQQQRADRPVGRVRRPARAAPPARRRGPRRRSCRSPRRSRWPGRRSSTPSTGMSSTIRGSTRGRTASAEQRMPRPRNGATSPNAIAQPNSRRSGGRRAAGPGSSARTSRSPVSESRPRKISDADAGGQQPGHQHEPEHRAAEPDASSSRNAPSSGEPSSELIAAKLPAAAITAAAVGGRVARREAHGQHAEPAAHRISGASGPSTAPKPAWRARRAPRRGARSGQRPAALKPSAGEWPPVPGRRRIASATSRPASASSGSGHHTGAASKPRSRREVVNSAVCSWSTSSRKPYATAETGTPMIAASTSSWT